MPRTREKTRALRSESPYYSNETKTSIAEATLNTPRPQHSVNRPKSLPSFLGSGNTLHGFSKKSLKLTCQEQCQRTIFSPRCKTSGEKQMENWVHPHRVGHTGSHHGELASSLCSLFPSVSSARKRSSWKRRVASPELKQSCLGFSPWAAELDSGLKFVLNTNT